ncbi:MAG TPA: primosomal protein N' [Solirubrobacteraceae bacterium]|nr:primosomal protein N' [Solirubrobacteraceae bacterium]
MPTIAKVEPLTTARALRGPFDYLIPDGLRDAISIGSTLVVPFARRELLGVVVGLTDRSEIAHDRLLTPLRAIGPGVPPDLVALAAWIAAEYCSTPARALSLMLPPGTAAGTRERTRLVAELTPAGAAALAALAPQSAAGLPSRAPQPAAAAPAPQPGTRSVRLTANQRAALERLREAGPLSAGATGFDLSGLRRLAARGLVSIEPRVVGRRPEHQPVGARRKGPPKLDAAQTAALARVEAGLAVGRHTSFLLHGVTGSGKTEVYLRAAAVALAQGRGVIVLVPEIGLTPQTVGRFIERFGDTVAVLHSGLGAGERYDEWLRLRSGEARICVGPRSAVFAPIDRIGLVVVDEEHDPSYKHDGDPRYDARHVAERRAERAGAVLIAGSATPRPESYVRLERLRLPERVDGRRLPEVEVLDMIGVPGALHPRTSEALSDVSRSGGKAIVLLNRRGWSNFLFCGSCGRVWGCPQCDVSLVLHRADGLIACHHCGHREPTPTRCPDCRSTSVGRRGLGTERLEHEFTQALGGDSYPVFRLDGDVAAKKGRAAAVLRRFDDAPAGVLVGTQMVAKGHDFDGVGLGVVLDADATLRFPDFRSEERTFALVAQLAGRAGRGPGGTGRVLVQTLDPRASSIAFAADHDSDGFLAVELGRREALHYPPYGGLIRIVCSSESPDAPISAGRRLRDEIDVPGAVLLGPAPLFRLRGRDRIQLVVKGGDRRAAIAAVGAAVDRLGRRDVAVSVDVDPQ